MERVAFVAVVVISLFRVPGLGTRGQALQTVGLNRNSTAHSEEEIHNLAFIPIGFVDRFQSQF